MAAGTHIQDPSSLELSPPSQLKYRPDIDGLRAIAVLCVIGFHAFPALFRGGFIGVDVFFVISGYLISGIIFSSLEKRSFSFAEFYARRIKRIFPALTLVLAASFAFGWFALLADEYQRLTMNIAGGAGFVANFTLWNKTDYFNDPQRNPLTHLWSLGVEEQFYLLWPMVLWLLWRKRISFLAVTLFMGVSSFIFSVEAFGGRAAAFYLPGSRLWELLLGSVLAYLTLYKSDWLGAGVRGRNHDAPESMVTRNLMAAVGILLIAAGVALISKEKPFPGWWALLPTAGTYLIVSAGPKTWLNRNVLANRVLVWIGLISYPLYLWHWPLLSFASILEGQLPMLRFRLLVVPLSIALATLTYILVEKPIRFGGYVRAKVAALCILMALIGCVGYTTYRLNGLESRAVNRLFKTNLHQLEWFNPDRQCLRLVGVEAEYRNRQTVFCSLHDEPDAVQVAIIGDSTANALYPGFEKIFKEKQIGVINIGNGTCAPFRGLHGVFDWNQDCQEINDKIYDFLLRNSQIKIVVLGLAAWDIKNMQFDGLPADASLDAKFSALSELMDKDVTALEKAGKKVVVTYDSPMFSIDPRRCVRRGIYWQ
jgi:peptidoglycan/LPS O-acetylase OafA/YrhL